MDEPICERHNLPEHWVIDPYFEEIHGEVIWAWICDECYGELLDDI